MFGGHFWSSQLEMERFLLASRGQGPGMRLNILRWSILGWTPRQGIIHPKRDSEEVENPVLDSQSFTFAPPLG